MATIESVQTSQVDVPDHSAAAAGDTTRTLRRARITILLRKTSEFDQYLKANPPPAVAAAVAAAQQQQAIPAGSTGLGRDSSSAAAAAGGGAGGVGKWPQQGNSGQIGQEHEEEAH